jgi:predicted LPLAT superfamily acyltransferase
MLGDRTLGDESRLRRPFLGEPAAFPLGAFRLAAMLRQPIVLMFGVYRGGRRYDIHFELLADFTDAPGGGRSALVEQAIGRYAERLEHYCRLAPYNWFNFYDFWH